MKATALIGNAQNLAPWHVFLPVFMDQTEPDVEQRPSDVLLKQPFKILVPKRGIYIDLFCWHSSLYVNLYQLKT